MNNNEEMNEIRQNKVTKQWVIYAKARGKRPRDFQAPKDKMQLPSWDEACPFCPGNERMLPAIIMELPAQKSDRWQTRGVPNRFPALTPEGDPNRSNHGIYIAMQGYGRHEVIIESPDHGQQIAQMSLKMNF